MTISTSFEVATEWEGTPLTEGERTRVSFATEDGDKLLIKVDAPYYGNEAPPKAGGDQCVCLWEFEVVEVFIKGRLDKYIEIEMSPHNQYLILALDGHRQVFHESLTPLSYKSVITPLSKARGKKTPAAGSASGVAGRWYAEISIPFTFLPPPFVAGDLPMFSFNVYTLHSTPEPKRRYCALFPAAVDFYEYEQPDCHRLHLFQPLPNAVFQGTGFANQPEQFASRSDVWNERLTVGARSSHFVPVTW